MRLPSRNIRPLLVALAYLAPSLVIFIAFVFVPLGRTIELSLFNTRVTGVPTTFAGLDHYAELLSSDEFRTGMFATLIFALYTVPIGIALGLVLAVLLTYDGWRRAVARARDWVSPSGSAPGNRT